MICKWCGETISATAAKCPKCGRETPPMSDCGGFYNLKTGGGETGAAPAQPSGPIRLPQLDKLSHMYVRDMKQTRTLQLVALSATMLVVLLLIVTLICIGGVRSSLNAQSGEGTNPSQGAIGDMGQDTLPEGDGDDILNDLPLFSDQDVTVDVSLFVDSDGKGYLRAASSLDASDSSVWTHTERRGDGSRCENVVFVGLDEENDYLKLTQVNEHESTADWTKMTFSVALELEGQFFGTWEEPEYAWSYRVGDGNWQTLSSDKGALTLTREKVKQLVGNAESAQLRCTITFQHPEGGTLTITLDGTQFNGNGFVANGEAPFVRPSDEKQQTQTEDTTEATEEKPTEDPTGATEEKPTEEFPEKPSTGPDDDEPET